MLRSLSLVVLLLPAAITLSAQVQLVYETGGRKLPVIRLDGNVPCYQDGGEVKRVPKDGTMRLEAGGAYSDRELEYHASYQVLPSFAGDHASGAGHVVTYGVMRPKWPQLDLPGYFYVAAWEAGGEMRQMQVRPAKFSALALLDGLRMSMKLRPGEETGFLRLYIFDDAGRCISGVKAKPPELREFRAALDAGDKVRLAAWCDRYAATRPLTADLLFQLIRFDDIPTLKAVLKGKTRANILDDHGFSALQIAAQMGNLRATEALLQAGARVEQGPKTALYFAADRDAVDVAQALLWAGAKPNASNPEDSNPIGRAITHGYTGMAKLLIAAESKPPSPAMLNRWLHQSMENHFGPMLSFLLEQGADPGAFSDESLGRSIMANRSSAAFSQLLSTHVGRVDTWGAVRITPLMNAAMRGFDEGVVLLLQAGADPAVMDKNGRTAAAHAAAWAPVKGRRQVVDRLLRAARHTPPQLSAVLAAALAQGYDAALADWLVREHGATFDTTIPDLAALLRRALEGGAEATCIQAVIQGVPAREKIEGGWTFAALAEYYGYAGLLAAMAAKQEGRVDTASPPVARDRLQPVQVPVGWMPKEVPLDAKVIEAEIEVLVAPDGRSHFPRVLKVTPPELAAPAIRWVMERRLDPAAAKHTWRRVVVPLTYTRDKPAHRPKS